VAPSSRVSSAAATGAAAAAAGAGARARAKSKAAAVAEAAAGSLPVLRGAHPARGELLQHASGGIARLLARSPLNEQGDPHGDGRLLCEALARQIIQAFRVLADNLDVRVY
jgi:hypothetical protein